MKNKVNICFSHYFGDSDIKELDGLKVGQYELEITKFEKPKEAIGGLIWFGLIVFISGQFTAGFLGELGKDTYNWLKIKLFCLKKKLKKENIERFTINLEICNKIVIFDLTDLDEKSFYKALVTIDEVVNRGDFLSKQEKSMLSLKYNESTGKWELDDFFEYD